MIAYLRGLALRVAGDSSAAMLLACNIVALVFAFYNPPVSVSVLFLYWAESAVIGVLNVVKLNYMFPPGYGEATFSMLTRGNRLWVRVFATCGFFIIPYSILLIGVLGTILALGDREMQGKGVRHYDVASHLAGFWFPVLLIAAGHVISFFHNFLGKREYVGRDFENQAMRPFKRLAVLVLVVFCGGAAIIVTRLPSFALLLFIPFILIASLEAHFRERKA